MARRVGITGGIGSGKSVVSKALRAMGYKVYDADSNSKRLCATNEALKTALTNAFGNIYNEDGTLNKALFASIIFNDAAQLAKANAIIHPFVIKDFLEWSERVFSNNGIVFVESAILIESELKNHVEKVINVSVGENERLSRIIKRDRCTEESARARIDSQMPERKRAEAADFIIMNGDDDFITPQIEKLLTEL
ncbi:MAG: dephospho-CoA kinase [Paludibacteraceae bacterium]|nr:dephospho-CoA kinase [Paludibacteraceae bacterium]